MNHVVKIDGSLIHCGACLRMELLIEKLLTSSDLKEQKTC